MEKEEGGERRGRGGGGGDRLHAVSKFKTQ